MATFKSIFITFWLLFLQTSGHAGCYSRLGFWSIWLMCLFSFLLLFLQLAKTTTLILWTPLQSEWPWLQKDMGPKSYQIWIWGPKRWPTPTKLGAPCNFCIIKFLPKCTVEAPEAPRTPFTHPVPKGGGYGVKNPPRTFPLEDHLLAKFHPDPSSGLDFFREQTDTPTLPFI